MEEFLLKYSKTNFTRVCRDGQSNNDIITDLKVTDENAEVN